jgi:uncharacterized protein YndB with AHSA1/START domain
MTNAGVLEVSVYIAAEPETVFAYFTDPARYVQWMGTIASLEPAPAGEYRVFMRDGVETAGEFIEVDPHRLVFTWGGRARPRSRPGLDPRRSDLHPERRHPVVLRHHDLPTQAQRTHHDGLAGPTHNASPPGRRQ